MYNKIKHTFLGGKGVSFTPLPNLFINFYNFTYVEIIAQKNGGGDFPPPKFFCFYIIKS
jgi:hypothetical protein